MTSITVYDGNNTIGGNKIYVEQNGEGIFLDFGMNFHEYDKYFESYLQPRTNRGIHDLWHLKLIPHLNIYRKDLIPSDMDISSSPRLDVKAVLLSHMHMDHYGNIGFLDESIPVAASSTTLALLKGIQDSYRSYPSSEVVYVNRRSYSPVDDRLLDSGKRYYGRSLIVTNSYDDIFENFLWQPSRKTIPLEKGEITPLSDFELPFSVRAYETDHSVFGSVGYILEGDHSIAYTGDIRLHGVRKKLSEDFIDKAKGSDVLIIEGTRLSGEDIFDSEQEVRSSCKRAIDISKGIVIADISHRNLERLELFKDVADDTNRQLVIAAKDAHLLYALEIVDKIDHLKDISVYLRPRKKPPYWEEFILQENKEIAYVTNDDIKSDPEGYIVCFSSGDIINFLDITPVGGVYIFSSPGAFKAEQEFDFIRLNRWLESYGIKSYGFKIINDNGRKKPRFIRGFHASGHASESELEWMINKIDPDIIIPIHTENLEWFTEQYGDKAKILKKGEKLVL